MNESQMNLKTKTNTNFILVSPVNRIRALCVLISFCTHKTTQLRNIHISYQTQKLYSLIFSSKSNQKSLLNKIMATVKKHKQFNNQQIKMCKKKNVDKNRRK